MIHVYVHLNIRVKLYFIKFDSALMTVHFTLSLYYIQRYSLKKRRFKKQNFKQGGMVQRLANVKMQISLNKQGTKSHGH